jgi:hypothetical protein
MHTYAGGEALKRCKKEAELVFMMTASVVLATAIAVGKEYPEHLQLAANVKAVIDGARAQTDAKPSRLIPSIGPPTTPRPARRTTFRCERTGNCGFGSRCPTKNI